MSFYDEPSNDMVDALFHKLKELEAFSVAVKIDGKLGWMKLAEVED